MGLFSVLSQATSGTTGGDQAPGSSTNGSTGTSSSSSASIATVLQLYTGEDLIQLEETSILTGYSALTYQAIQIGSMEEDDIKNRHVTPDLGVWNCRGGGSSGGTTNNNHHHHHHANELVDSLLETLAPQTMEVYCLTVDLSNPHQVEPSLTLLQNALARHLIQHPPTATPPSTMGVVEDGEDGLPPTRRRRQTATTSLYDLQATEFGKAKDDTDQGRRTNNNNINESFKNVMVTLMICAKLAAPLQEDGEEDSSEIYKMKQAQALVIYHLRKFAATLNCVLCFVTPPPPLGSHEKKEEVTTTTITTQATTTTSSSSASALHPTVDYKTLSRYWRDLALDEKIWEDTMDSGLKASSFDNVEEEKEDETNVASSSATAPPTPETVEVASALYGPGKHQEDLIERVVLRSANYPGHWDASKDSLWVALPAPTVNDETATLGHGKDRDGDAGWLGQLRESIASAADIAAAAASPDKKAQDDDKKKDGKDAEVSDFFASLLKNP